MAPRRRRSRTGRDELLQLSGPHADAWIGLLETHKRLTRGLEAELEAAHGLSISALEVLSRLARADDHVLRLTKLAGESGLSLSRVSRIVGTLERRGLVERTTDTGDARAKNARLTPAGLELLRVALETHFAGVEREFLDVLSDEEIDVLGRVFERFRA